MEEVEAANKAAIESCHRILNLLTQPQNHLQSKNLMVQTSDAVYRFKKVVSLLDDGLGHSRVRKFKKIQNLIPQNILLDNNTTTIQEPPKPLQFLPTNQTHPIQETASNGVKNTLSLGNHHPSLELSSIVKNPTPISQKNPNPSTNYQFLQNHHQQQTQLQLKKQQAAAEMMYRRSNSGLNLTFDSSVGTPTISSNRSFMSSLSIEGSVTTLDGSSFQLIGSTSRSTDQGVYQHKPKCLARGDDESAKCGSSGRCHCSKKRFTIFTLLDMNHDPFHVLFIMNKPKYL